MVGSKQSLTKPTQRALLLLYKSDRQSRTFDGRTLAALKRRGLAAERKNKTVGITRKGDRVAKRISR